MRKKSGRIAFLQLHAWERISIIYAWEDRLFDSALPLRPQSKQIPRAVCQSLNVSMGRDTWHSRVSFVNTRFQVCINLKSMERYRLTANVLRQYSVLGRSLATSRTLRFRDAAHGAAMQAKNMNTTLLTRFKFVVVFTAKT